MMVNDFANGTTALPGYPDTWLQENKYQYGPRIYDAKDLQNVADLAYVNMIVDTTPGNGLNLIRETQRTNLTERILEFLKGRFPVPARNLTHRIMKTG